MKDCDCGAPAEAGGWARPQGERCWGRQAWSLLFFPHHGGGGLWSASFGTYLEETRPEPYLLLDAPLLLLVEGVTAVELGLSLLQFPGLVGGEQSLC